MNAPLDARAGTPSRKKMRLGDMLLDAGVISEEELTAALALQKRTGHKIGRSLMDTGAITESELHAESCRGRGSRRSVSGSSYASVRRSR